MLQLRLWALAALLSLTSTGMAQAYRLTEIAGDLAFPWCLAFLPDGDILVTERDGQLRIVRNGKLDPTPIDGVPPVYVRSQGGLFDVLLHPAFESNRVIYLSYAHGDRRANATRLARGTFDGKAIRDLEVLFEAAPMKDTPVHYGGRMRFLPDGTLLLTLGDGFNYRAEAQRLSNHFGSTVRLNDDGSVPADNPFVDRDDARPEIWTYGHRNPQGLAVDPATGTIYLHEHGAKGGDEVNVLKAGANYGWPAITWGLDYTGARVSPFTELPGMEQPIKYWVPSIAPSGMTFYTGSVFPAWQGDLFVSALVDKDVERIDLDGGAVVGEEKLFADAGARLRDVRTGPDGHLYLLTDEKPGRVLRVDPAP